MLCYPYLTLTIHIFKKNNPKPIHFLETQHYFIPNKLIMKKILLIRLQKSICQVRRIVNYSHDIIRRRRMMGISSREKWLISPSHRGGFEIEHIRVLCTRVNFSDADTRRRGAARVIIHAKSQRGERLFKVNRAMIKKPKGPSWVIDLAVRCRSRCCRINGGLRGRNRGGRSGRVPRAISLPGGSSLRADFGGVTSRLGCRGQAAGIRARECLALRW